MLKTCVCEAQNMVSDTQIFCHALMKKICDGMDVNQFSHVYQLNKTKEHSFAKNIMKPKTASLCFIISQITMYMYM